MSGRKDTCSPPALSVCPISERLRGCKDSLKSGSLTQGEGEMRAGEPALSVKYLGVSGLGAGWGQGCCRYGAGKDDTSTPLNPGSLRACLAWGIKGTAGKELFPPNPTVPRPLGQAAPAQGMQLWNPVHVGPEVPVGVVHRLAEGTARPTGGQRERSYAPHTRWAPTRVGNYPLGTQPRNSGGRYSRVCF